jgi:hypothetical protein
VSTQRTRSGLRGLGIDYRNLRKVAGFSVEVPDTPFFTPAEEVDDIETADATDAGTTEDLVNECKAKINELLGALRDAGLIASPEPEPEPEPEE